MDIQVAGATVETKSGKNIWTVTNTMPLEGFNNGNKGNTARAAPGLVNAVTAGGLVGIGL